jgi:hypothetical protein
VLSITIPKEIQNIDPNNLDFGNIEFIKELIIKLLNIIDSQAQSNEELQKQNQKLEDEINRLKGEKGKPKFSSKDSRKEPEKANTDTDTDTEKKKNWAK